MLRTKLIINDIIPRDTSLRRLSASVLDYFYSSIPTYTNRGEKIIIFPELDYQLAISKYEQSKEDC